MTTPARAVGASGYLLARFFIFHGFRLRARCPSSGNRPRRGPRRSTAMMHAQMQTWGLESAEWVARQQELYVARLRDLAAAGEGSVDGTRFMELFAIYKARAPPPPRRLRALPGRVGLVRVGGH